MSIEKMREEFEAWLKREWPKALTIKYNTGDYRSETVQQSWVSWQASRASVVVELPVPYEGFLPRTCAYNDALAECRTAIEAAGLRVKP